jgi:hypothetical protein
MTKRTWSVLISLQFSALLTPPSTFSTLIVDYSVDNARRRDRYQEYVCPLPFGRPQSNSDPQPPRRPDLIRKHQNPRQPDSDTQEHTRSPSQASQNTPTQPQHLELAIPPIEQPQQSHPSPEAGTKREMVAASDGHHPKSNMPTYKGLENFKLVAQMGESVFTAHVSDGLK